MFTPNNTINILCTVVQMIFTHKKSPISIK